MNDLVIPFPNLRAIGRGIGNFFARLGFGLGADQEYIPNVGKLFDSYKKHIEMYYDAASGTRIYNDWGYTTDTFYNNAKDDLKRIISRSRSSVANQALSSGIDRVYLSNVVGTGIRPEPVVKDDSGTLAVEVNRKLAEGWARFNDQWDREGRGTYYEAQKMALRTIINSGSILVNTVKAKKGAFLPIAYQMIEPDRLDWSKDWTVKTMSDAAPAREIQFGMELDEYGAVERFWVGGLEKAVPASQMDIRFARERLQQYIGVPWKAPVLKYLWNAENILEDKSVASRIQAMIALWVKPEDAGTLWKGKDDSNRIKWEPGRIISAKQKPEVVQATADENFDPVMRLIQRMISLGAGLSYQIATKDLQGMNFAASRANIIEDRNIFRMTGSWFAKESCQRDWNNFVYWMFLSGKMAPLTFSDYLEDAWRFNDCHWMHPGFDWVDPLKDANAQIELHNNNMLSLKEHYADKGKNWDAELVQIALEKKRIKELEKEHGISMAPPSKTSSIGGGQETEEVEDGSRNE